VARGLPDMDVKSVQFRKSSKQVLLYCLINSEEFIYKFCSKKVKNYRHKNKSDTFAQPRVCKSQKLFLCQQKRKLA